MTDEQIDQWCKWYGFGDTPSRAARKEGKRQLEKAEQEQTVLRTFRANYRDGLPSRENHEAYRKTGLPYLAFWSHVNALVKRGLLIWDKRSKLVRCVRFRLPFRGEVG